MLDCVKSGKDGVYVEIHAVPGSKKECVAYDPFSKRLRVKVSAQAADGRANERLLAFFRRFFGCCEMSSGASSRKKTLFIRGKTGAEVSDVLESLAGR